MSNNTIVIDQERVEAGGKLAAQRNALNELKAMISSMVDSVRGDDALVITCSIGTVKKEKKDVSSAPKAANKAGNKKPSAKVGGKSSTAKSSTSAKSSRGKAGESKPKDDEKATGSAKQEVDPLSEQASENK